MHGVFAVTATSAVSRMSLFVRCSKSRYCSDMVTSMIELLRSQPYLVITIYPIHTTFTIVFECSQREMM